MADNDLESIEETSLSPKPPSVRPGVENQVGVMRAGLQEHAQRILVRAPDQRGIDVTAADVGKGAAVADDLAKGVRPFPSDGERSNPTGTHTADSTRNLVLPPADPKIRGAGPRPEAGTSGAVLLPVLLALESFRRHGSAAALA